jgi:hypothetical protein
MADLQFHYVSVRLMCATAESAGSVTFKCSVPVGEYDGSFNEVHAILRRMREEHFQVSHLRFFSFLRYHTTHKI